MIQAKKSKSGFTLVELAIVLVIIGLIVGGVLVGQDLIKAATIRATVTQIEKFNAAATTFRGKYNGYPGDLLSTKASGFGFVVGAAARPASPTTGMGDGNGLVEGCAAGAAALAYGCETALFWTDLTTAGLLPNTSPWTSSNLPTLTNTATLTNVSLQSDLPKSRLRDTGLFAVFTNGGRNYFALSNLTTDGSSLYVVPTTTGGASPLEARGIDEKLDDGTPLTGTIQAIMTDVVTPATAATAVNCITGTGAAATYLGANDTVLNTVGCSLSIRTSF